MEVKENFMVIRALTSFLILPGIVGFLIPFSFIFFFSNMGKIQWAGLPVAAGGIFLLVWCVRDFYVFGKGTLAPWDPPKKMVKVGLYQYMRNPMYVGVLTMVLGWGILFQSPALLVYTGILFLAFHIRILTNEEPWLAKTFGRDWQAYKDRVPRWRPRLPHK